jgi:hypothetical protein
MRSHAELTSSASILHAAFVRTAASGNTFITFELNQLSRTWTNAVGATIPCRSTGDLLLAYDIGGSTVSVTIDRWTGDGAGPASCPNGPNGTFTNSSATDNGLINSTSTITNFLSPATVGPTVGTDLFGEAQIDVAAVLNSMGVTGCFSYIQAQAHRRSSQSISSSLIDHVPPVATKVANCAVSGTVYGDANANGTRDGSETGMAGRMVYMDADNDATLDPGELSAGTDAGRLLRPADDVTSGAYPRPRRRAGVLHVHVAGRELREHRDLHRQRRQHRQHHLRPLPARDRVGLGLRRRQRQRDPRRRRDHPDRRAHGLQRRQQQRDAWTRARPRRPPRRTAAAAALANARVAPSGAPLVVYSADAAVSGG